MVHFSFLKTLLSHFATDKVKENVTNSNEKSPFLIIIAIVAILLLCVLGGTSKWTHFTASHHSHYQR